MTEPKRIKAFRFEIANRIPKFPNDKASLHALQAKSLGDLLVAYANWAIRYVSPGPRAVVVEPSALNDPRWQTLNGEILALLKVVKDGRDLTPYLSLRPHTRGFTPAASAPGPGVDRWADKDMLLNVMGYHHFHLDAAPSNKIRSNEVLFAHVTRTEFTVVGVFDHSVFEAPQTGTALALERKRLWAIFDERSTRGVSPGSVVMPTLISTSGHSFYFTNFGMDCARIIHKIDPNLNDPQYILGLYEKARWQIPAKPRLRWSFSFLTLGLLEEKEAKFFVQRYGPN